jgi:hypothetical protein
MTTRMCQPVVRNLGRPIGSSRSWRPCREGVAGDYAGGTPARAVGDAIDELPFGGTNDRECQTLALSSTRHKIVRPSED